MQTATLQNNSAFSQDNSDLFTLYRQNGYKPVLCKGYHRQYNPNQDYKIAKQPKDQGFTSKNYVGPTDEVIEKWISEGGGVGWVLPEGVLVVDYDDGADDEQLIESIYLKDRINPGVAKTNNGKQAVFKNPGGISGIKQYCKIGPLVCYRIGGKNQCIWPPTNGRTWDVWKDFKELPDLPKELYPASSFHDYLTVLSWQLGKNYRKGLIQGNDDIDLSYMAYLTEELKLSEAEACKAFLQIFGKEYDQDRTVKLYQRVLEKIKNGEPLRGAGTFIQTLKDKGFDSLIWIITKINGLLRGQENKQTLDILSQIFTWNEIANLDLSVEWLLEKLIPKGAITLVFCPGGGGKTWLLMQIARAIATGERFGELQTLQTPVYFVDFENPLVVVKERREKIGPAMNFYYWHLACPVGPRKLDSAEWEDYKQLPPGLIIFDTLRASHLGDENSSKDMALVLSRLKELREAGFTIVILHHTPKGNDGTYKGSTAILDLADHVLSLENTSKRDDVEFDADAIYKFGCKIKTRFEPNSIYLSFDPEHGFSPKEDPDISTMKIMANILKKEGPLNQNRFREILEAKLEMKKSRIFKLLKRGTGTFWKTDKGDKNSIIYSCLLSCFPVFPLTKVAENRKTDLDGFNGNGKGIEEKPTLPFDNTKISSFPKDNKKTDKQDLEDSEEFQAEVERYLKQGLSKSEAIWLAREGL
jgi:hypothetical protein